MRARRLLLLAILGAAGACARSRATLPVDPGVTFAVHRQGDAFRVDRMRDGTIGVVEAPGWLKIPNAPALVLRSDGDVRAALWHVGRTRVLVRADVSTIAPRLGEVLTSWDGEAVRLALWAGEGHATFTTDTFHRDEPGTGAAVLDRTAARRAPLYGAYRAPLRDGAGTMVGWLRVRIDPSTDVPRAYDGTFPSDVEDGLAVAAAVALDAELDWIEGHATSARDPR